MRRSPREALRSGASSYVPKRDLVSTLVPVVRQVLSVNQAAQSVREVATIRDRKLHHPLPRE